MPSESKAVTLVENWEVATAFIGSNATGGVATFAPASRLALLAVVRPLHHEEAAAVEGQIRGHAGVVQRALAEDLLDAEQLGAEAHLGQGAAGAHHLLRHRVREVGAAGLEADRRGVRDVVANDREVRAAGLLTGLTCVKC